MRARTRTVAAINDAGINAAKTTLHYAASPRFTLIALSALQAPGYSFTTRSTHKLPSRLVIVRIGRYCFVIQEIGFVLGCTHTLEGPGWLVQIEEVC